MLKRWKLELAGMQVAKIATIAVAVVACATTIRYAIPFIGGLIALMVVFVVAFYTAMAIGIANFLMLFVAVFNHEALVSIREMWSWWKGWSFGPAGDYSWGLITSSFVPLLIYIFILGISMNIIEHIDKNKSAIESSKKEFSQQKLSGFGRYMIAISSMLIISMTTSVSAVYDMSGQIALLGLYIYPFLVTAVCVTFAILTTMYKADSALEKFFNLTIAVANIGVIKAWWNLADPISTIIGLIMFLVITVINLTMTFQNQPIVKE